MTSRNSDDAEDTDYDLTCWYLNARRVIELVGARNLASDLRDIGALSEVDDAMRRNMHLGVLKDALGDWLKQAKPPTLGQLLATGQLDLTKMFTHYTNYFCRGLSKVREALDKGRSSVPLAEAYAKLDEFRPGQKISFHFHHEHLTSNSSWVELAGQKRLLVLGKATRITDEVIEAIPWVIADPIPDLFRPHSIVGSHWSSRLEIHIDSIDNFAQIQNFAPPRASELELLRTIPEAAIKAAFAEIIGEPTVPKDWGGEQSDMFSSFVRVQGKRISTAFAFKGPAKFHPMTVADLGKNGDQIGRLFAEPADLLVLQHCHEITPPVRGMMRAYAQQMGHPRLFCLISGFDTLRVLRAYHKCGL